MRTMAHRRDRRKAHFGTGNTRTSARDIPHLYCILPNHNRHTIHKDTRMFNPLSEAARAFGFTTTSSENQPIIPMHQYNRPPANIDQSHSTHPPNPPATQNTDVVTFGTGTERLFEFAATQIDNAINPRRNPFFVDEMDQREDETGGNTGGEVGYSLFLRFPVVYVHKPQVASSATSGMEVERAVKKVVGPSGLDTKGTLVTQVGRPMLSLNGNFSLYLHSYLSAGSLGPTTN